MLCFACCIAKKYFNVIALSNFSATSLVWSLVCFTAWIALPPGARWRPWNRLCLSVAGWYPLFETSPAVSLQARRPVRPDGSVPAGRQLVCVVVAVLCHSTSTVPWRRSVSRWAARCPYVLCCWRYFTRRMKTQSSKHDLMMCCRLFCGPRAKCSCRNSRGLLSGSELARMCSLMRWRWWKCCRGFHPVTLSIIMSSPARKSWKMLSHISFGTEQQQSESSPEFWGGLFNRLLGITRYREIQISENTDIGKWCQYCKNRISPIGKWFTNFKNKLLISG